ncbi:hypothetical protein FOZ60_009123 [Perkinsus olseni]|uniref:Uncharacterized protein n=1 Tax=Perkinsus olseni TaxID=32597 RepID=A0A7J6NJ04_PEROL|nr:hypothetical protein FOZ60_009123 [Perkinsus olseni]
MYKVRKSLSSDGEVKYKPNIEAKYVDDSGVFSDLCYIAPRKGEAVNQRWGVLFQKHDDKYLIPLWAACNKNPALEGAIDSGRFASTGSHVAGGSGYIGRIMEDDEKRGELRGCSTRLNRLFKKLMGMSPDFTKTVTVNVELSKKKSDKMLLIIEICKYSKNDPSAFGPPDKGAQFIDTDGTLKKYADGKPAQSSGTDGTQQQYTDRRDDDEDDDDDDEEEEEEEG